MTNMPHKAIKHKFSRQTYQHGAALIVALMILAIVAAIAADLISRSQIDIRRTDLILSAEQADLNTTYALAWAQRVYLVNQQQNMSSNSQSQSDQNTLNLPLIMPTQKIGNAAIDATLSSAQGRFNINNLIEPAYIPLFSQLLQNVDADIRAEQSMAIANDVAYFIGNKPDPQIEQIYATFTPPYFPAHRLLASPSEVRLVKGITANLYQKLAPYIIALPTTTSVDPSAASKALLLGYGVNETGANAVISYLKNQGRFKNISEFYQLAVFSPAALSQSSGASTNLFDLQTQYFLLTTTIKADKINWVIYSILQVDKTNGKLVLLQQTRNTL